VVGGALDPNRAAAEAVAATAIAYLRWPNYCPTPLLGVGGQRGSDTLTEALPPPSSPPPVPPAPSAKIQPGRNRRQWVALTIPVEIVALNIAIEAGNKNTGRCCGIHAAVGNGPQDDRIRNRRHTCDVVRRTEENYVGPAVIRTARLRNLARSGQTVVSREPLSPCPTARRSLSRECACGRRENLSR
jgi:hypothetical protein